VSRAAIELIKRFEGYRRAAAQLPDGRWTIGHGHTLTARQGAEVSEEDAEALLLYDLIGVAHALNEAVFTPINQNQFDALASFTFNLGLDNFHQSGVLRRLNEGALIQAACAMELWRKANVGGERIVVDALVRRRAVEKTLFLTPPDEAWVAAPSPILPPLLDTDARDVVPLTAPVQVNAELQGDQLVAVREGEPAPAPVAPEEDAAAEGPAKAAAEAVTARLSTIFQAPGEEAAAEPEPEPPAKAPLPAFEDPVPFFLRAPDPDAEPEAGPHLDAEPASGAPWRLHDDLEDEGPRARDLFGAPGEDILDAARREDDGPYAEEVDDRDRRLIDDSSPFEFDAPVVQPLPGRPEGGVLTLVALAVLGLVFFGGGIFWATYARAGAGSAWLGPRLVGGLAGIAGVGFFVVAVYLLLDRLGRAAEREARDQY
jgi:lysozyme